MIKKSVFEDDLIRGMQNELIKQAHNVEVQDLSTAADYLNSAAQILEEIGMVEASDKVLNLLLKVAEIAEVPQESSLGVLFRAGLTLDDLSNLSQHKTRSVVFSILRDAGYDDNAIIKILPKIKRYVESQRTTQHQGKKKRPQEDVTKDVGLIKGMLAGDPIATAKVNAGLRDAGKNDAEIIDAIGFKHFMPEREVRKILSTSALNVVPSNMYQQAPPEIIEKIEPYELEDVVAAVQKLRNPDKISDRHTKGLTPDKMINNLKHHGTMFNLADDGLLDHDIDNNNLEVSENDLLSEYNDFEDEID